MGRVGVGKTTTTRSTSMSPILHKDAIWSGIAMVYKPRGYQRHFTGMEANFRPIPSYSAL